MTNKQRVAAIRRARRHLHDADGYQANGIHYREVDKALNSLEADFLREVRKWSSIGAVTKGGASVLDMSLTHRTSGIDLYPAIDLAWGAGVALYAPESVEVWFKDTSANPGEAVYLKGNSGMKYWLGHIDRDHPLSTKFARGAFLGKTVPQPQGVPHGHLGVNGEAFLGSGKQFLYGRDGNGPNYTIGAPTIRNQLLGLEV